MDWLIRFDLIWFDWLIDWIGSNDIITYPYAWTVNFKICLDVQLRTRQVPIPKTSQAAAWRHRYIGHWMRKTEGSLAWIMKEFRTLNGWKKPLVKVTDFLPLGPLSGPGPPDPDLAQFRIEVKHRILNISLYVCNNMNIGTNAILSASLDKSMGPSKITLL